MLLFFYLKMFEVGRLDTATGERRWMRTDCGRPSPAPSVNFSEAAAGLFLSLGPIMQKGDRTRVMRLVFSPSQPFYYVIPP